MLYIHSIRSACGFQEVRRSEQIGKPDRPKVDGGAGLGRYLRLILSRQRSVEQINRDAGHRIGQSPRQIVDHLEVARVLVELNMYRLTRALEFGSRS